MKKLAQPFNDDNYQLACEYIQKQLDTRSWWPKAQPRLAKQEFNLMKNSPVALWVWCDRWLDSGQLRKLKISMKNHT